MNPYKTLLGTSVAFGGTTFNSIRSISLPNLDVGKIDVSHLGITHGYKEYINEDLIDAGQFSFQTYATGLPNDLQDATGSCVITMPIGTWTFDAEFGGSSYEAVGVNQVVVQTIKINILGEIT